MASALDDMMSELSRLPYYTPMMSMNLSGLCATTRILQTRNLGLGMCDISRKFEKDASIATDLHVEDFMVRKENIAKIKEHNETLGRNEHWIPILYNYELYRGAANVDEDYGHLVFTERTLTKYLMVNMYGPESCACGNPYHNDYEAMVKLQAQRLLNLLVYLQGEDGPRPKWVRATFTTLKRPVWNPKFLTSTDTPISTKYPPIVHLTPDDLVPSLRSKDITLINSTIAKLEPKLSPAKAVAKYVREEDKARVLDDRAAKTKYITPHLNKHETERECAGCNVWKPVKSLKLCSGCQLTPYCSRECQRKHWRFHKLVCRKAVPASQAPESTPSKRSAKTASKKPPTKQIEPPPPPVPSLNDLD